MSGRILSRYKRLSESRQVEDSGTLRLLVWGTTEMALLILWRQQAISPSVIFLSIAGVSAGSCLSHLRRHKNNWWIKLLLTAAMTYLLVVFLGEIRSSYSDLRLPLASLFLWLQVLHSFDLPGRRDLLLSVVSSFVLLGLASTFSLTTGFLLSVTLYLLVVIPTLITLESSRLREGALVLEAPADPRLRWPELARITAVACMTVILLGTGVSALLPQEFNYVGMLPFSPPRAFFRNPQGGVMNPGYPDLPSRLPGSPLPVNPDAYFGIASYLDLRMRGRLSDSLLMRVKSTTPSYWRGMAFDTFVGNGWERSTDEGAELAMGQTCFTTTRDELQIIQNTRQSIQTFYIERELPNVIYGAYRPRMVYFPSTRIEQDPFLGLRSPFLLDQGLVYSVVSELPAPPEEALLASPPLGPDGGMENYLQLPAVSGRVRDLVGEVTAGAATPYEKALALQAYLQDEYSYSLVPPGQTPDEDSVEFFLFESGEGTCEHFATTLAVTCRIAGIPARLVTGFATGDFNPFSGMYEVGASDAHAWVELYFPGVGWVPFEATPGFTLPGNESGSPFYSMLETLKWLGRQLAALVPPWLRSAVAGACRAVGSLFAGMASFGYHNLPVGILMLLFLLLLPLTLLLWRRRLRALPRPAFAPSPREIVVEEFVAFSSSLARHGHSRDPSSTPREYLDGFGGALPPEECEGLLEILYRARYGDGEIEEYEALDFRARLRGLRERLRGR
jgi:transglutaminase-like putative cysteine protease